MKRKSTIREARTKALISCAVTAQLICAFVFAYADCWFYDTVAHYYYFVFVIAMNTCVTFVKFCEIKLNNILKTFNSYFIPNITTECSLHPLFSFEMTVDKLTNHQENMSV